MMKKHKLPELPYGLDALEPQISSETLQYHYKKHHAGYVDKLNGLIEGTSLEGVPLEEILVREGPGKVFNNAAQAWNHTFYWNSMTSDRNMQASAELADKLIKNFGSLMQFRQDFAEVATGQFGSGWAWLVREDSGKIKVISTANADNPLKQGLVPLLVCDVWEHAYYIDYRNDRSLYVEKFLELVNWDFMEKNLEDSDSKEWEKLKIVGATG
jgi:Fe-Mn family superoxide dismutase